MFAATRGGAIGGKNRSSGGFEIEEFSARSVDEALAEASAKLGLPARELTYEIRDAGASGFLGIGYRPATVAVRIATPHTADSPSPSGTDTLGVSPGDERDAFAEGSFVGGDADEAAAKVRHPNPKRLRGRSGGATSARPPQNRPRGAPPARPDSAALPERGVKPSDPAEDPRVVMEAAQRLGALMNKIRQRVAAGGLVYDPNERRLVEATPTGLEEDDRRAAVDRAANPPDSSNATGESGPAGYLTVPEAARELGESVPDVLGRIGRRELACERISGVVKVRRQAVLAIKEGQAARSPRPARPVGRDTGSRRSEPRNGGSELRTAAENRVEELQERADMLEGELRALRKELEEERLRSQQRGEWIEDLRSKLEESDAGRRRAEEALVAEGQAATSAIPLRGTGHTPEGSRCTLGSTRRWIGGRNAGNGEWSRR